MIVMHRHYDKRAGRFRNWRHSRGCIGCDGHGNARYVDAHCACGDWAETEDPKK